MLRISQISSAKGVLFGHTKEMVKIRGLTMRCWEGYPKLPGYLVKHDLRMTVMSSFIVLAKLKYVFFKKACVGESKGCPK